MEADKVRAEQEERRKTLAATPKGISLHTHTHTHTHYIALAGSL